MPALRQVRKTRERICRMAKIFYKAMEQGTLPQVSFYKPIGNLNEHPGYTDVLTGDQHLNDFLNKIKGSPLWKNTVVIVTYDENGGFWDHVAPP